MVAGWGAGHVTALAAGSNTASFILPPPPLTKRETFFHNGRPRCGSVGDETVLSKYLEPAR